MRELSLIAGIGAGGCYPLSAVLAKEAVNRSHNMSSSGLQESTAVALVFSMQGLGYLLSPLLMLVLLASPLGTDAVWRLHLGRHRILHRLSDHGACEYCTHHACACA